MSTNSSFAKSLRFIGIVLMALTGGFTFLGGVGTTCAALFPTRFGSMAVLAPFQWLYILFVVIGIALGIMGIRATILLIKGTETSYRDALIALIAGVVIGVIHIAVSRALRNGQSIPVDIVVYATVITLVVFLLFRIPTIWQGVDFTRARRRDNLKAGGAAAILLGLLALTIQYTMGPTHTWNGVNYANAFNTSMTAIGVTCLLIGAVTFLSLDGLKTTARKLIVQE